MQPRAEGDKWGFSSTADEFVVAPECDAVEPFEGDLARVRVGRGWGAIDRSGTVRIAPRWQALGPLTHGLVWAKRGCHVELLDHCGRRVQGPYLAVDHIGARIIVAEREHDEQREWAVLEHDGMS